MDENRLQDIVDKAVAKALSDAERRHEAEIAGLRNKNAELRGEKHDMRTERDRLLALAENRDPLPKDAGTITLTREEASDPSRYRAARMRGEAEGKRVVILDDKAPPAPEAPSRVKVVETDGAVFVNRQLQDRLGLIRARELAKGKTYQSFRTAAELPDDARAKHSLIEKAGDPEHLIAGA